MKKPKLDFSAFRNVEVLTRRQLNQIIGGEWGVKVVEEQDVSYIVVPLQKVAQASLHSDIILWKSV